MHTSAPTMYGTLSVIGDAPSKSGHRYVTVRCTCGDERTVRLSLVRSGRAQCRCSGAPTPGALTTPSLLLPFEQALKSLQDQFTVLVRAIAQVEAQAATARASMAAVATLSDTLASKPDLFADLRAAGQAAAAAGATVRTLGEQADFEREIIPAAKPAPAKRPTLATVLRAEREALGRELTREEKDATVERNVNAPALALANLPFAERTPEKRNDLRDLFILLVEQLDSPNMFDRPDLRMHVDKIRAKAKRSLDCWESPNYDPSEY